ncbi:MAG: dTDP-4-dehydrorhamnose 3,5-epimerase, dTDP-4-dehydrorhamnose 3,5-epimerase [Candidatus Peregrinibacteria bacterium GW2011_GWC2_39_14]|nr:MAG: dTDP-4-dehydrorhamnose 3,5-epimerase-like protein enzyme [Candidatus Peregrinibacteria bacterium GW2011_GWA2_38_36]KKR05932.1 MAG: dTDP-4-dehydrorhamnose 3,5-epimerase, dTDP-4-dehydrorhamnose 3,5-epimerase [Candidatus Peregrinibacteria bacterium GW2011_GWC2_39_14]
MKIIEIKTLGLSEVKVVRFERFLDDRGYFTEPFRRSDFDNNVDMGFLKNVQFLQCNESFSKKNVMRGLHFQWNPCMGKLVRLVYGRMFDFALDIRKDSPNFGKIVGYELKSSLDQNYGEWIWVPVGFAHGVCFLEDSLIEYFCSSEYSPGCEASILPISGDIDWSLCDTSVKSTFDKMSKNIILSEKDKQGLSLSAWRDDDRSSYFVC